MAIPIVIGSKVTTAGPVFSGAFGIAQGTRCVVLDIPKVAEQGVPPMLVVQVEGTNLLVRMPVAETMEGQVNILEDAVARSQQAEVQAKQPKEEKTDTPQPKKG